MKNLLCVLSVVAMVFTIGTAPNVALAGVLTVNCEEAQNMLETCSQGSKFACTDCCNQNFSGLYDDCYEICYTRRGQTNDKRIAGCNNGQGGGNTCANGSCSSSSDCANNATAKVCDSGCCREPNSNETVTLSSPVCNGTYTCSCEFVAGNEQDNYETWLATNCGIYSGTGSASGSFSFPTTGCATSTNYTTSAILQYGDSSSQYPGCDGYIEQSSGQTIKSCTSCNSGYTLETYGWAMSHTYGVDYVTDAYSSWPCTGSGDSFPGASSIGVCVKLCTPSYGNWASYGRTGYERQSITYPSGCSSGGYNYRCADGYYGTPNSTGTSGCTECPSVCGNVSTTSTAGSNSTVGTCCAAAGDTGSDAAGSFKLKSQTCAS